MYKLEIYPDTDPINPRDKNWTDCNLGAMICFHKRYIIGDEHSYNSDDYNSWDDIEKQLIKDYKNDIILPIYMYDHSGQTINTTGFSCRWDSGQIGFIILDRAQLLKTHGVKRISKDFKQKLFDYLIDEVSTYDKYMTGDVWGYVITDEEGICVSSCGGYYGRDDVEQEGQRALEYLTKG